MMEQAIRDKYFEVVRDYVASQAEEQLMAAAELGREMVLADVPPEEVAELHDEALRRLAEVAPDIALATMLPASRPMMELLMAYGLVSRARNEQLGNEIAERRRAEGHAEAQRERLEEVMDGVLDGIATNDNQGIITQANRAFARIHGYDSTGELIGKPFFDLVARDDLAAAREMFGEILSKRLNKIEDMEFTVLRKDGSNRVLKNPFDHPPDPLPGQEGGSNCIWGTPPDPWQRGFTPLHSRFSAAC